MTKRESITILILAVVIVLIFVWAGSYAEAHLVGIR